MTATLELTRRLIARPSITPDDQGCQNILAERLQALGFKVEHHRFNNVDNLWARRGSNQPLFVFAGHTDVVPPGPLDQWQCDPFTPTIIDNTLYGRGAADMKSSIAAMICACEHFVDEYPQHHGSIGFLITSDEEGPATDGTVKVVELLKQRDETIDWCLVGEPSSTNSVGDIVKNGRRGSLSGNLKIIGTQGHIAYPHLADNPIHRFAPALRDLVNEQWDQGNDFFPPTSFQISNINAGTGANNVIPASVEVLFNLRFSTAITQEEIRQRIEHILDAHNLDYKLVWVLSGNPFLTPDGRLIDATQAAIKKVRQFDTELSTSGGTSDGRFIAPTGAQVVELGPVNASIHKINENIDVNELEQLTKIYHEILVQLLTGQT
ncbi:MAG: succinyl-diaminopimelate desuccinylase [Gammaproteobacteria bacterium]|nr:succinyl-diaminopimelate desuccinylase [Gammaproteobacteria bacterium]